MTIDVLILMLPFVIWVGYSHQLKLFDFAFTFPLRLFGNYGKFRGIKKKTGALILPRKIENWRLLPQERELCDDYANCLPSAVLDRNGFEQKREFLRAAGQTNITPMRWWMWVTLFILMIGEAAGTGALLSEFVSTNVTSNEVLFFTWGSALILATVLLGLTHKAGASLFVKNHIKAMIGDMDENTEISYKYKSRHDKGQFQDDDKTPEERFLVRMDRQKDRGTNGWAIAVVIALILVFVGVFGARWYGIQKQNALQVVQMEKNGVPGEAANPFAAMGGLAINLPPSVQQAQAQTRKIVAKAVGNDMLSQGFFATLLLSLLYLIVQGLGFSFAYTHTFFNKDGANCHEETHGHVGYDSYKNHIFEPLTLVADTRVHDTYDGRQQAQARDLGQSAEFRHLSYAQER